MPRKRCKTAEFGWGFVLALVGDLVERMNATVHAANAGPGLVVTITFCKAEPPSGLLQQSPSPTRQLKYSSMFV